MSITTKVSELPGELHPAIVAAVNAQNAALAAIGALPHHATTELVDAAAAASEGTLVTLANDIKAKYVAHIADTDAHVDADETNTVAAADATDLATANTLLNEVKGDFNAHVVLAASHRGVGGLGGLDQLTVTTANGTDQTTGNTLGNAMKAALNRHFGAGAPDLELVPS